MPQASTAIASLPAGIVQDIAQHASLLADSPAGAIEFIAVEETVWNEPCFELSSDHPCEYAQTMPPGPGFKVIVKARGQSFLYHTNKEYGALYAGYAEVGVEQVLSDIRAEYAEKTGVEVDKVEVLRVEEMILSRAQFTCRNASSGPCAPLLVGQPGFTITLSTDAGEDRVYARRDGIPYVPFRAAY